ncbi:MAG: multidrug transporter MatE [Oscillospiraceae bacterium]|nr:multidrug transporter MatE [Oscillospiraceae bacterium]
MELLTSDIRRLYRKFLLPGLGGALVMSIYSFVDSIAVGQSEGPVGAAAMAVVGPLFGVSVFLAIMCGVGGSVLMSEARGQGDWEKGDDYFTASVLLMAALTLVSWLALALFGERIMAFFGAEGETLTMVMKYARWLIGFWPAIIFPIFLGAFIRNDGAPGLATGAVVAGGALNIFGDWFLVFFLGLGIRGAAIATVAGTVLQAIVMIFYFFRKSCRLRLRRPRALGKAMGQIVSIGFGAGVLDLGTVFIGVITNNQLMRYGGAAALSVYGVLTTITALFQSLFGGVGQAIQPIASTNFGAGQTERIGRLFRLSLVTVLGLGAAFVLIGELFPAGLMRLFMSASEEVLAIAPGLVRRYFLVFLPLGITVLATYYLQSILRFRMSMAVSVLRSFALSGLALWLLPMALGTNGVMLALPGSEVITAVVAAVCIRHSRAQPASI